MPNRKKLLQDFYAKYAPDQELTDDRLAAIDKKYGDNDEQLLTDFYAKYAPDQQITPERLDAIYAKYELKKKEQSDPYSFQTFGQSLGTKKTATPSPLLPSDSTSKSGVGKPPLEGISKLASPPKEDITTEAEVKVERPNLFKGVGAALPTERKQFTDNLEQKAELEERLLNDPTYTLLSGTEANQEKRARVYEQKNEAIAKERGYDNVEQLYNDMDEYLTGYLDERQASQYAGLRNINQMKNAIVKSMAAGQPTDQLMEQYNQAVSQYSQAKAQQISTADQQIKQLRMSLDGADAEDKPAILDQIKQLEASKQKFFLDPKVEAAKIVKQEGLSGSVSDQEKVRRYAHALMREKADLMNELGLKSEQDLLSLAKETAYNTFLENPYYNRLLEVDAKIKSVAPIALLNETPITDTEGAWTVFGKTFMQNLVPAAQKSETQQQKTNKTLEGLRIAGVNTDNIAIDAFQTLENVSKPYEDWSTKDIATMTGATAAFLPKFAVATMLTEGLGSMAAVSPYWRSVKILSERGSLGTAAGESALLRTMQANNYGRGLLKRAFGGVEFGVQSKVESILFNADRDEVGFVSGFTGGFIGKSAELALKSMGKAISSFFGSKAPEATNKLLQFAKLAGGKVKDMNALAIGETGEELGEELGNIWQQSENGQEFFAKVGEEFGDPSNALKFFLSSYMMGLVFGAGTEVGKYMSNKSTDSYSKLSPTDKAKADQIISDLKQEQNQAETQAGVDEIQSSDMTDNEKAEAIKEVTNHGNAIDDVITGEKTAQEVIDADPLIAELEKLKVTETKDEKTETEKTETTILDSETAQTADSGTPATATEVVQTDVEAGAPQTIEAGSVGVGGDVELSKDEKQIIKEEGRKEEDFVSTRKYFKKPYQEEGLPNIGDGKGADYVNNESNAKEQVINIAELIPTQKIVEKASISSKQGKENLPIILKNGNDLFVMDGHHRIAAEMESGKAQIKAQIFDVTNLNLPTYEQSLKETPQAETKELANQEKGEINERKEKNQDQDQVLGQPMDSAAGKKGAKSVSTKGVPVAKSKPKKKKGGIGARFEAVDDTDFLAEALEGVRVSSKSYGDNSDPNYITPAMRLSWFKRDGGKSIDQLANDLVNDTSSPFFGRDEADMISDIVNFITQNPTRVRTYKANKVLQTEEEAKRIQEEAEYTEQKARQLEEAKREEAMEQSGVAFELIEETLDQMTDEQIQAMHDAFLEQDIETINQLYNEQQDNDNRTETGATENISQEKESGRDSGEVEITETRPTKEQLEADLKDAEKALASAENDLTKARKNYEKALSESQIDLMGNAKQDALLFKANLPALNKRVKEFEAKRDEAKALLEKAQTALDNFVPDNQVQMDLPSSVDPITKALDSLKIDTKGTLNAFGLIPAAWNATIDTVKAAYIATKNIAEAIEKGLEYARKWAKENNAKFDEAGAKQSLENAFGVAQETTIEVKEVEKEKPKTLGTKERAFTNQFKKEYPQMAEAIKPDTIEYKEMPNKVSIAEANALIDYLGMERAIIEYKDFNNGMSEAVRSVVGQVILRRLQAEGRYNETLALLDEVSARATEMGQGIQALSLFAALTPEGAIRQAQKGVTKAKERRAKQDKKRTDKVKKEFKKANKEAVDEVLEKPEIKKKIGKSETVETKPSPKAPEYGSKNKIVTKDRYAELKKKVRGSFFAGVAPELIEVAAYHIEAGSRSFADFSKSILDEFGKKAKPYLKGMYEGAKSFIAENKGDVSGMNTTEEVDAAIAQEKGQEIVKRIEKAIQNGNKVAMDKAIAELQDVAKQEGLWGKYKKLAVSRLKNITIQQIQKDISDKPPLQEFVDGLIKNIGQQIQEALPTEKKSEAKPRKAIEVIGDAYANIEKYREAWEQTQKEFRDKYKDNPEVLAMMDAYFGEILDTPFSEGLVKSAVKQGLKEMGVSIPDIIKEHYTVYDYTSKTLAEKLVDEAGLTGEEAKQLAEAVQREFDKIATEKKRQALEKILSKKERKKQDVKGLEEELIRLTNLGVFTDEQLMTMWADKMGYPKLTPEQMKEITRLADAVQNTPEGFKKFRAIEDLLTYQANLKGVSAVDVGIAVWYANILSGYTTQLVNTVANLQNSALLWANATAQNPTNGIEIAKGFVEGLKRGLLEAEATFKTGYSPIRGKVEVPGVLERKQFKGFAAPLNYAKYVGRAMKAADVLLFEANKEMRAYQIALKMAAKDPSLEPIQSIKNKAAEMLGKEEGMIADAMETAQLEYEQEVAALESQNLPKKEHDAKIKQLETDKKRRVFELIEMNREGEMLAETADYAARATYNYKPEGVLGWMASMANQAKDALNRQSESAEGNISRGAANALKIFVNSVIPFTNIIANVANEALNYSPVGALRAASGKTSLTYAGKELTQQEKIDLYTKSMIGLVSMTALYLLSQQWEDDDDVAEKMYGKKYLELTREQQLEVKERTRPIVEITANGYGDYRKNYKLSEDSGWQKYSIRVGDKWISYQYSPLFFALGFIGQIRDYETYRGEKLSDDGLATKTAVAMGYTMQSIMDATFVSNLSTLLNTITDPKNEDRVNDLINNSIKTAQGVVAPNLYLQIAKGIEDAFDIPSKEVRNTKLGAILQHVPVARNMYYDKLNALGEQVDPDVDKFVSSAEPKDELSQQIFSLMVEKNVDINPPPPKTNGSLITNPTTGESRYMTQEEYYNYVKKRGEVLRQYFNSEYEYDGQRMTAINAIAKMDKKAAKKVVSGFKSGANDIAKQTILGDVINPVDYQNYIKEEGEE